MQIKNIVANGALALLLLCTGPVGAAQESHVGNLTGNASHGKALYRRYCVYCHGVYGDGRGESAPYLDPKPRDFTSSTFKCRSTPTGSLPLDSDLYDTVTRGIHASGMPSWKPLTRQQRVDLVAYIKSFATRFQEEKPTAPVDIPSEPASSADSVKRGGELFQSMNCWLCHGKEGRGNGPSAVALTDTKGYPITPFDFTSGPRFKCGDTDRELYRDLVTGLDGTPMPSFGDAMKPDQIWDVVHFIKALASAGKNVPNQAKVQPN